MREIDEVLAHCDVRLAALLLLCAHAGLRVSEALDVKTADIQGAQLTVHDRGGKVRRVPLGKRVRTALTGLPPVQAGGQLFDWSYHQAKYRMGIAFRVAGHGHTCAGFTLPENTWALACIPPRKTSPGWVPFSGTHRWVCTLRAGREALSCGQGVMIEATEKIR